MELTRERVRAARNALEIAGYGRASSVVMPGSRPLLLGHRGARPGSRFYRSGNDSPVPPENTLACFEYALSHGVEGFEFDVRQTGDKRLVLCHNSWLRGRRVSASSFEGLRSKGLPFCCLEEVLAAFANRAYLDIELKIPGAEEAVVASLRRHPPRCGFLISSFLSKVLVRLHELDSSLPLGYVCKRAAALPLWRKLPIQVLLPHCRLVTKELVDKVHDRGLQVFTWTVNQERELHQLAGWGIDGVISDDPALLAKTFAGAKFLAKSEEPRANSVAP